MNETPILRQLLICEKLIFEQGTGNVSLINCHEGWLAEHFPSPPIPFIAYGVLTDGFGTFTMQVRITRLDTGEEIYRQSMPMLMTDRLHGAHFVYRNKIGFPAAARYEIAVLADNELLGLSALSIRKR